MNLSRLLEANMRVLLVGPPGLAKTGRILTVAKEKDYDCYVSRASLSERVDYGGCLVPDFAEKVTKALPLEHLHKLQNTDKPTILFLDDLGQAPIDVQAACMRLFDNGYLPSNVIIWGATNRPGDKAGVTALCEPLRSRFDVAYSIATPDSAEEKAAGSAFLSDWKTELENWINWAMDYNNGEDENGKALPRGAPAEVIAYHRSYSGKTLYQWKPHADPAMRMPDYRSWETVIRLWKNGIRDLHTIGAAIGKPVAAEFIAFAQLAEDLPTPDQVRMDPEKARLPKEPPALYLIASMLAMSADKRDINPFLVYLQRMPRIYGALLGRDLYRRLGAKISGEKSWVNWFQKNQELFLS